MVIVDDQLSNKLDKLGNILFWKAMQRKTRSCIKRGLHAEGLVATLTAKGINPNILVVARAERPESEEKLRRAEDGHVDPEVVLLWIM